MENNVFSESFLLFKLKKYSKFIEDVENIAPKTFESPKIDLLNQENNNNSNEKSLMSPKSPSPRHRGTVTTLIPILKKFLYMCKRNTEAFKFKVLTPNSYSLVNDLSVFPTENNAILVLFLFLIDFKVLFKFRKKTFGRVSLKNIIISY